MGDKIFRPVLTVFIVNFSVTSYLFSVTLSNILGEKKTNFPSS